MFKRFAKFFPKSKFSRPVSVPLGRPLLEILENRINPSFANLNTISQSLRLAEDALPQIPGLDASLGQMAPDRLSDLLGQNAYGNGASTWAQMDTLYPNPTVSNLKTIATTITTGSPYSTSITPILSTTSTPGNSFQSSTTFPAYGNLPDLMLGQYAGFTIQGWFNSTNIADNSSSNWQRIIDLGNGTTNNIVVALNKKKISLYIKGASNDYNYTYAFTGF